MGFSGFSFGFWRVCQIITLIPIVGMLSYFVHGFTEANQLTPNNTLVLFIVSVLALAWTVGTLFLYSRARHSAKFVAFVDLLFFGALIAGVYYMRGIGNANCSRFQRDSFSGSIGVFSVNVNGVSIHTNKTCAMYKASWAFAIMNIIFFALTFFFALLVHRNHKNKDERVVKRETHVTRHSHRSSRSPRRSHHSSRRSYHV
jgi:hypothetical protein